MATLVAPDIARSFHCCNSSYSCALAGRSGSPVSSASFRTLPSAVWSREFSGLSKTGSRVLDAHASRISSSIGWNASASRGYKLSDVSASMLKSFSQPSPLRISLGYLTLNPLSDNKSSTLFQPQVKKTSAVDIAGEKGEQLAGKTVEISWIQEESEDIVLATSQAIDSISGPTVGDGRIFWPVAVTSVYLGISVVITVVKTLSKYKSPIAQRRCQTYVHWNCAGRVAGRMFLILTAVLCVVLWIGGRGPAYACEGGTGVLVGPLIGNAKLTMKSTSIAMWPKTRQVLEVLRDQGLFLSMLLGLSAFFSMAETSITTLWPWKVRELAEKEGEGGVFHVLRQDVTRFLTTILIGTTVVNIAATAMVTEAATALFGEAGVTAATGVMTVVLLLLTEIAPKSIAVHNATEVARVVVRPVAWLSIVLYPVGRVVTAMSTSLLKLLGLKSSGEPFVSEEELKLMLRGAELSGAIEEEEQDMIENVLEIKDTYVREVMTPLVDVVAIDAAATLLEFRNLWVKHQYSRVPVFERRIDNIVGIAYAMDMLDYVEQGELLQRLSVGRIAHRPAYFVPDSMSVWNLLREFRIRKVHMAIVLNEYGGTVGVVTLEDVVEEIVGEIFDENDSKEEIRKKTGYVVQRAEGVFDVDANTSIEDLAESLEVKLPEGSYHYETVSGFVCESFGYIPRTGESTKVVLRKEDADEGERRDGEGEHQEDRRDKFQKYRLEILAGNARKVGSVRFERIESMTQTKEENERAFPRALRRGQEADSDEAERSAAEEPHWQDPDRNSEDDSDGNEGCLPLDEDYKGSPTYYLPESVRCSNESYPMISDMLSMVGTQDWEIDTVKESMQKGTETGGKSDVSTASIVATLADKWEKEEAHVERRRNRRRKQSAEAAMELNKQRRSDLRRREAEAEHAMSTSRRSQDDPSDSEFYQESEK